MIEPTLSEGDLVEVTAGVYFKKKKPKLRALVLKVHTVMITLKVTQGNMQGKQLTVRKSSVSKVQSAQDSGSNVDPSPRSEGASPAPPFEENRDQVDYKALLSKVEACHAEVASLKKNFDMLSWHYLGQRMSYFLTQFVLWWSKSELSISNLSK
jgi:hypothetical protein